MKVSGILKPVAERAVIDGTNAAIVDMTDMYYRILDDGSSLERCDYPRKTLMAHKATLDNSLAEMERHVRMLRARLRAIT